MDTIQLPEKVKYIIQELRADGFEAFAVGGCVRDSLLGRIPGDWDITTNAKPAQVKQLFPHTIDTGIEHGTVTVMLERDGFEVTTYRIDGEYEDARHPKQVEFTQNLTEDLCRRDFTINAMAYSDETGLIDVFGGMRDLEQRVIRCVGRADDRFDEDALRIMRAVRFSAQLGFSIEQDTLRSIASHAGNLSRISIERIRTELTKLLLSDHPERLLAAQELGLTRVFLPEFDRMLATPQENPHHIYDVGAHTIHALQHLVGRDTQLPPKNQLILRYAVLLHDVGKPAVRTVDAAGVAHFYHHAETGADMAREILRRLRFDNETIGSVGHLIALHDYRYASENKAVSERTVRRAVNRVGPDWLETHFLLQEADLNAQNPALLPDKLRQLSEAKALAGRILSAGQCISLKMLAVNGSDLIAAGFPPGKSIGAALDDLLNYVLEHPEANTREELLARAAALLEPGKH
ncbi:MAG: CCA tRNA nucleotidyltransferase [Lachnospiraceae bacterium]|nr:CCA tRNA nucleotidyltransferase [Lachnospiraceae bacterium]